MQQGSYDQHTQYSQQDPITREFTLVDGMRVRLIQLYQASKGDNIIILLDGAPIGAISSLRNFLQGQEIALIDGSILRVQLINNNVQVSRNGLRLPAVSSQSAQFQLEYPTTKRKNRLATAGFTLGVISVVADITIFLSPLGILAAVIGIVLSALGRRSLSYKYMATWGLILSVVGLAVPLLVFVFILLPNHS